MPLLQFLFVATAAALDVMVTCGGAPNYYMMDGIPNKPLSIVAGDIIFFNFDIGCAGFPLQIQNWDGTTFSMGPLASLATSASTPGCLVYRSMTYPTTMTGTITVVGGMPCGATITASASLYNRPIIAPLPSTTTTLPPLYGNSLYASAAVSLYNRPPVCPVRTCPPLAQCVSPAYAQTNTMADGCPGCAYCYTPLSVPLPVPITLPAQNPFVLPPIYCPTRSCPLTPKCVLPAVEKSDIMADGCPGCTYCAVLPAAGPCTDLSCLPCCPLVVLEGQICRSCVTLY